MLALLQRQVLFTTQDIGAPKTKAAAARLTALNPGVSMDLRETRLTPDNAETLLAGADLVLDGCDSFETRRAVNAACVKLRLPLISGALGQWDAQLSVFDPASGAPYYHCLFPTDPAPGSAPSCAEAGVVGALAGMVGSMMALEAVKRIAGAGRGLEGRLLLIDSLAAEFRVIGIERRVGCAVCGDGSDA